MSETNVKCVILSDCRKAGYIIGQVMIKYLDLFTQFTYQQMYFKFGILNLKIFTNENLEF